MVVVVVEVVVEVAAAAAVVVSIVVVVVVEGAVVVVAGSLVVVVAVEVVADAGGDQEIAVGDGVEVVELWETVDHVVVVWLVVDAAADSLVGAVSVGHDTADVPVMEIEGAGVVEVLLGLGPVAADVVATEPVDVQDQVEEVEEVEEAAYVQNRVEEVEEAADVQYHAEEVEEVEVEVEGQVEDQAEEAEELEVVEEVVEVEEAVPGQGPADQVVVGVLVPVGGEWLVCQPVFVGQSASFGQYAGSCLQHTVAKIAMVASLVVVLVER